MLIELSSDDLKIINEGLKLIKTKESAEVYMKIFNQYMNDTVNEIGKTLQVLQKNDSK
jgi:hypothetical protein